MNMLKIHKEAREDLVLTELHNWMFNCKTDGRIIFGFCEGKDDISFYKGPIEGLLNENWEIHLRHVGGASKVLALYDKLDWREYNKKQIIFFIDRDLTEFTGVKLPNKENIYITDNYSIENDVVNSNTCERVLTEILGFSDLTLDEKKEIKKLFDRELIRFIDQMVPIMSLIVHWHKNGHKASLKNICMDHLFEIKEGVLENIPHPKQYQDVFEYIHKQCNLSVDKKYDPKKGSSDFRHNNRHKKFTRGKYLLWFLTEFCLSVHRDCLRMPTISITCRPKNHTNLSQSNAIVLISSRFRMPDTLKKMLKTSVGCYVAKMDAA